MNPNKIYLTQTDTTVGFLSADSKKLAIAKHRDENQPFLICVDTFTKLKKLTRIPKLHKKRVRRTINTSFLYSNKKAIRVIKDSYHSHFLKDFDFLYSTSANKNLASYDLNYAHSKADIIIEDFRGLCEYKSSRILKLGKKRIQKRR